MNACNQCTETKPVPTCIELLTIGVAEPDTAYWVYIKNNATGYQQRQEFTTEEDGVIKLFITVPYADFFTPNFYYTLWITLEDENIGNHVGVTIAEEVYDCFTVRFENVYVGDQPAEFATYTLEV